ncbi:MAG TPA: TonB family protein [Bryobacteraceae bacterium]|jgi:TonB family protein|nr:TonB family protein [Bryobacteraceae bacterium]
MTPQELEAPQSTAPADDPDVHLQRLLAASEGIPWYKSLVQNVKEIIHPKKLPPLELTSTPVPVKEIWGFYGGQEKRAGLMSMLIHGGAVALLLLIGTNDKVQQVVKDQITLIAPDLKPYIPAAQKKNVMGGGGGGGDRSPVAASKGKLPKFSPKQFVPPAAVIHNENPKLVMEPTLNIQPDAPVPKVNMSVFGDPLAKGAIPSNGTGSGAGIGSGSGGGVGSGSGNGYGPGSGGNFGGGAYKIGGGVSSPLPIFKPDPDYSEEARKAKFQGTVVLAIIVDEKGLPRDVRVVRPLGLGLDQKAIEAVQRWRFRPGMKDGKPVPVQATIEVNFRLL